MKSEETSFGGRRESQSNCMLIESDSCHCVSMTLQRYEIGEGAFGTFAHLRGLSCT